MILLEGRLRDGDKDCKEFTGGLSFRRRRRGVKGFIFPVSSLLSLPILSSMTSMKRLRRSLSNLRYKALLPSPFPIKVVAKSIKDEDCFSGADEEAAAAEDEGEAFSESEDPIPIRMSSRDRVVSF